MYATPITLDQLQNGLTPDGNCGVRHYGDMWSSKRVPQPPAVAAWATVHPNDPSKMVGVVLVCAKHNGIIKAAMTKGSYMASDYADAGLTVEAFLAHPMPEYTRAKSKVRADYNMKREAAKAATRDYARAGWEEARAEYHAPASPKVAAEAATLGEPDIYGRTAVYMERLFRNHLTPNEARDLAARLIRLADAAEKATNEAVMP